MHRNEFKTIAEGFKKARPGTGIDGMSMSPMHEAWERTVQCVAESLGPKDKALSNFYAACGVLRIAEG